MTTVREYVEWWDSEDREWKLVIWQPPGNKYANAAKKLELAKKVWPGVKFQLVRVTTIRAVVKSVGPKKRGKG